MAEEVKRAARADEVISLQVPADQDAARRCFTHRTPGTVAALVARDLLADVQQAVGAGVDVRAVDASVGRGASGLGAAIQVLIDIGGVVAA